MVIQSWKMHNTNWDVIVLSFETSSNFVVLDALLKDSMTVQAKIDIIGLALLSKYGGIWIDATVLCMKPLDTWVWDIMEPAGFWMPARECSWFMIAAYDSYLANKWFALAKIYWSNRSVPPGEVGGISDDRWMDGVLKKGGLDDIEIKKAQDAIFFVSLGGPCSIHMFFNGGCEVEPNQPLVDSVQQCLESADGPPAIKMSSHDRCGKPVIADTDSPFSTNGHYAIYKSLGATNSFNIAAISDKEAVSALIALRRHIDDFNSTNNKHCRKSGFGTGWGEHALCDFEYKEPCFALSYGISNDYTFEIALRKKSKCTIFAFDPTINHSSELFDGVYFMKFGAPVPWTGTGRAKDWIIVSPTSFANMVNPGRRIAVLKMDCEGCEYSLYDDIMKHDPFFFTRVKQFAVEIHLTRIWMRGTKEFLQYGKLIGHLLKLGFRLQDRRLDHCAPEHEASGVIDDLTKIGYYLTGDGQCQNLLFARE